MTAPPMEMTGDGGGTQAGSPTVRPRTARAVLAALLLLAGVLLPAGSLLAAAPSFDAPTASGSLGTPLRFSSVFRSEQRPERIELLTRLKDQAATVLEEAGVTAGPDSGTWLASMTEVGHILPNSTFDYWFQAVLPDGQIGRGSACRLHRGRRPLPVAVAQGHDGDAALVHRRPGLRAARPGHRRPGHRRRRSAARRGDGTAGRLLHLRRRAAVSRRPRPGHP